MFRYTQRFVISLLAVHVLIAWPTATATPNPAPEIQRIDRTTDPQQPSAPKNPAWDRLCYLYPDYNVIAWRSPDPGEPVAIVRKRDPATTLESANCSSNSLPGDFVLRSDGTEYFSGMWGDLLLTDCGTSNIRELILYDVPSRRQVLSIGGFEGTDGWTDSTTVRIWALSGEDMPRPLCPEIPEMFSVGVDSLFAFNIETLSLKALGSWRCRQLQ